MSLLPDSEAFYRDGAESLCGHACWGAVSLRTLAASIWSWRPEYSHLQCPRTFSRFTGLTALHPTTLAFSPVGSMIIALYLRPPRSEEKNEAGLEGSGAKSKKPPHEKKKAATRSLL